MMVFCLGLEYLYSWSTVDCLGFKACAKIGLGYRMKRSAVIHSPCGRPIPVSVVISSPISFSIFTLSFTFSVNNFMTCNSSSRISDEMISSVLQSTLSNTLLTSSSTRYKV